MCWRRLCVFEGAARALASLLCVCGVCARAWHVSASLVCVCEGAARVLAPPDSDESSRKTKPSDALCVCVCVCVCKRL